MMLDWLDQPLLRMVTVAVMKALQDLGLLVKQLIEGIIENQPEVCILLVI